MGLEGIPGIYVLCLSVAYEGGAESTKGIDSYAYL